MPEEVSEEATQETFDYELDVDKTPFTVGDKEFVPKAHLKNGVLLYTAESTEPEGHKFPVTEGTAGWVSYSFKYKVSKPVQFMKQIKAGPENSN